MTRFISCDWGTSRFRLRLIEVDSLRIAAEHTTDEGVQNLATGHTTANERPAVLAGVLERGLAALGVSDQPELPIVMSGMASSNLGWQLLPYAHVPAPIEGHTLRFADFQHGGRKIRLVSGLQSATDVMRGEEVELVGLMSDPARRTLAENSVVILPGSHSKHVQLNAGQIVEFTTYLTGELFNLLRQTSTLANSDSQRFDTGAFVEGLHASRSHSLSAVLFQTRARTILGQMAAQHSESFLSGVLIGAEIGTLVGSSAKPIVLAAGESLAGPYGLALRELLPASSMEQVAPTELATAVVRGHAMILRY